MELRFALQPKQLAFLKMVEETPITFYGGAKGGGKSKGIRDIMLWRRFQYAKTHGALFRRTYKELEGNHIRPIFKEYPALRDYWNESKKLLTLPNGSTLEFCHCENERDTELYQGREFEDLAIEEAGQWTEQMFRTLLGSNRSATPGFRPRTLLTGNPGGIGHTWLKRLFIERRYNDRERPEDYAFIQALVDDNAALIENDPAYVHRLNTEPNEALRKAYRYGDWDIFAGQYFGEIRREVHFIKPFAIPTHWTRFGAYDFGFTHPAAFGWFAVDGDGNVYLYRELVRSGLRIDQFATAINQYHDTAALNPIVAGLDAWAHKQVISEKAAPTIAEEFQNHGLSLTKAAIDRVQGATNLRNYLAWNDKPNKKPKLFIFDTCPITYEAISRMQVDPDRPEDVLKQNASDGDPYSGDDAYDMLRYALMSRPLSADQPIVRLLPGSDDWAREQSRQMEASIDLQARRQQQEENESDLVAIMETGESALHYYAQKRKI